MTKLSETEIDALWALDKATDVLHQIADRVAEDIATMGRPQVLTALERELYELEHDTLVGLAMAALMGRAAKR